MSYRPNSARVQRFGRFCSRPVACGSPSLTADGADERLFEGLPGRTGPAGLLCPMLALLAIFGTSFVVGLSGALMPGPLFTLTVRETLRRGFWAGPVVSAGHALIELALVIGLAVGLKRFLEDEGPVTGAVALAGGAFLLWMGYGMLRSAPRQSLSLGRESVALTTAAHASQPAGKPASSARRAYGARVLAAAVGNDQAQASPQVGAMASVLIPAGVLVSVSNPYWVIWWASVGAAYMSESLEHGAVGVGSFFTGHILSDFAWLTLVAFVLASGRRIMSRGVYRGILVACGLFLLVLGTYFVYSGIGFLR
jgi:threonine/homoserine/homoserine lactone efflux protein